MAMGGHRDLTIGDLARSEGVTVEAIRYYEREGLMPRPPRTHSGRRAYHPDDLKTLSFIRRARELGFSLHDTRALLALRTKGHCEDVTAIASKHLANVRTKLHELTRLEATLSGAVACCRDSKTENCEVLNILEGRTATATFASKDTMERAPRRDVGSTGGNNPRSVS
jgi:MerR family mercuric resistance operon transcriptional regulator